MEVGWEGGGGAGRGGSQDLAIEGKVHRLLLGLEHRADFRRSKSEKCTLSQSQRRLH